MDRNKRNLILFIISYFTNNLISGILYDTYVNYLQEVSLSVATSFWAFYGYASFISALIIIMVPKIGYKKLIMFSSLSCALALFAVIYLQSPMVFFATTILSLVGVQLHFIMLAPYVAAYTGGLGDKKINWYSRAYYIGYVGYFVSTYLGGLFTVKMFARHAGVGFQVAKEYSSYIADVTPELREAYLMGNKDVLLISAIISLIALIPALMISERKTDYYVVNSDETKISLRDKLIGFIRILLNKDALTYVLYWAIISFSMGMFTSYFTVYLNRNLHIAKSTASLMVSLSYIAIVLFMLITPICVKKFGRVGTISLTLLLSIPFMLIIANGNKFGAYMIPVVGIALFMRSGLANLGSPAESSLNMAIVPKNLRPAFTSLINIIAGIVSIISGNFTGKYLFLEQSGYKTAYYYAAALYFVAFLVMFIGLKKYNRQTNDEIEEEEKYEQHIQ
jgi:MFS family permease